ncbi:MAG TPA: hypothetical protein DCG51_03240 [Erysipelotrichaceae bacterium]|nr:hypothetical protein [Solobacterium sp.]HAE15542.1 hypothetical protein [Erysipelotrichaceae bacterium]
MMSNKKTSAAVKDFTKEQYELIAGYVGRTYQIAKNRMDLERSSDMISEPDSTYADDAKMVYYVDRCLLECDRTTQLIIRKEYLEESAHKWYEEYFSRSTYYRLKTDAIRQFVESLNL